MLKKRILAMVLAASMIFQSFGTVSFAAETTNAAETSAEGVIVEDVVPEEVTEAAIEETVVEDTVTEEQNETVTGIEKTQEEAVIEEIEDITEETVEKVTETFDTEAEVKDEKGMADAEHLVDDTLGYTVSNLKVTPGSYHAQIEFEAERYIYGCSILYTTEESAGESFFPGVTSVSVSEIDSSEIYNCSHLSFEDQETENGYKCEGKFSGDDVLQPNAKYYIRMVTKEWDHQSREYRYYFLTMPESFTTGDPVTSTQVSFSDFQVESAGYNNVLVSWTLNNPLNEYITNDYVWIKSDTEDGQRSFGAEKYYDNETGNSVPNKYCALIATNGKSVEAWIKCTVYTGDNNETEITSDKSITVVPKQFKESYVSVVPEAGSGSFHVSVKVDPYYGSDYLTLKCFYRENESEEYEQGYDCSPNNGVFDYQLNGLKSSQSYKYYLVLESNYYGSRTLWTSGSAENPLKFETKSVTVYEDSQFPDATLRNYLKEVAGVNEDGKLTSAGLESIRSIYRYDFQGQAPVTSLEGLQYCTNLTELDLQGQDIEDASVVSSLKNLTYIYLTGNDLKELPNLSELANLQMAGFTGNVINESSITQSKLPADFLIYEPDWLSNTKRYQRGAFSEVVADTYYAIGDTHPFIIQLNGVKSCREYTLSVEFAGTVYDVSKNIYSNDDILYISDLGNKAVGEQTVIVNVTDQYGKKWLEKSYDVTFEGDENKARELYVSPADTNISGAEVILGGIFENSEGMKLQLLDGGSLLGTCDEFYVYSNYSDNRYDGIFDHSIELERPSTVLVGTIQLVQYLSEGDYDLKLLTPDEAFLFEDVIHVSNQTVIEEVSPAYGYDNDGDYIYIQVYGVNIDADKISPVLYKDGKAVTQLVATQKEYSRNIVYKLKKLDKSTYWTEAGYYDYRFIATEGDDDKVLGENGQIYIDYYNKILFSHYNYKKGVYEVKFSSALKEGTEVSAKVVEGWDSEFVIAHGQGKISDGMLELTFTDNAGVKWIPQQDEEIYIEYEFKDISGEQICYPASDYVQWYNYSNDSVNERDSFLYSEFPFYETGVEEVPVRAYVAKSKVETTDKLTISVVDSKGNVIGESVSLTYKSETMINQNVPAYCFEGTWKSENGIAEAGYYSLQLKKGDTQLTAYGIGVYAPDVFYVHYQDAGIADNGTVFVGFGSEKLYGDYVNEYKENVTKEEAFDIWKNNYQLKIFDRAGEEIKGWEVVSAEYEGYSFYVYITGLPKDYVGFYFKITDQQGRLGVDLETGQNYYSTAYDSNETYGSWDALADNNECFPLADYDNLHGIEGIGVNSLNDWPVTVTVKRPYDIAEIDSFEVDGKDDLYYYFTDYDLSKLSKDEVYRVTLKTANGNCTDFTGYLVSDRASVPEDVPVTGVTLDRTHIDLKVGESTILKATINPSNATDQRVTWSSNNEKVATVNENGEVTGESAGTAKITATTGNGKTATCSVKVFDYSISAKNLSFDLYNKKTPIGLKIKDGIPGSSYSVPAEWTSDNSEVATVNEKGIVTPVGVGNATITAKVDDDTSFSCEVIVTYNYIDAIELSETSLNFDYESGQLSKQLSVVKFLPENTTMSDKTIKWSSSNPKVASVDENGNVTAEGVGKAIVTAMTVNGKKASCQVTVYKYELSSTKLEFELFANARPQTLVVKDGVNKSVPVTWKIDDDEIATVAGGKVTPLEAGKATVTAKIKGADGEEKKLECSVIVTDIKEVTLDKTTHEMLIEDEVQLTAFIDPLNTKLDKTITWTSSDEKVVSVDENGKVTALEKGTATITATVEATKEFSKPKTATCTINVYENISIDNLEKPEGLYAITNFQAKLKDVILKGDENGTWSWENPETALKQFACMGEAKFTAIYTPKDKFVRPVKAEIPVSLVTISKLTLEADKTTILAGNGPDAETVTITPKWTVTGNENILGRYKAEWLSSNVDVATVDDDGVEAVGKGSAKITAKVTVEGHPYTASVTIKVLDKQTPADIGVKIDGPVNNNDPNNLMYTGILQENNKGVISVTLKNASGLTVSNSNAKVVKTSSIKPVNKKEGTYEIPFELLTGGTTKITLTANDTLKTTKDIWLTVNDPRPSTDVTTLTINKLQTTGASFTVLLDKNYSITSIELSDKDKEKKQFDLQVSEDLPGECTLYAKKGTGKSNGYKIAVKVTVGEGENAKTYELPLTVKVTEVKPKVTVKQSGKVNLFYKDSKAELMFTTTEKIKEVTLDGKCTENYKLVLEDGKYYVKAQDGVKNTNADKTGTLKIKLEGWDEEKPLLVNYTVGVEKKAPKLALTSKSGILYPALGIKSAQTSILMDGKELVLTDEIAVNVYDKKDKECVNDINGIAYEYTYTSIDNRMISFTGTTDAKNAAVTIAVQDDNWTDSVKLPYTLSVKSEKYKPALKLSKGTLQLNVNEEVFAFDMASTQAMWKDATEFAPEDKDINVEPADAKAKGAVNSGLNVAVENKQIVVKLGSRAVAKGTYKFKVSVKVEEYTAVTTLNVKVVDAAAKKSIQLSTKGSIDVLNRTGSYVTVTPKLNTINGTVTGVTLSGRNADLFKAELLDNGSIRIQLKKIGEFDENDMKKVITGYNYGVNLNLQVANENQDPITVMMDETKLNLKQGSVKLAVTPTAGVLYSNADSKVVMNIQAILKGADDPKIERIELLNYKDAFEYDDTEKELTMKANGEAAKGKSYTLQFEVTLKDKADNVKPMILKYKVTVK